jgi:hypothetical protein
VDGRHERAQTVFIGVLGQHPRPARLGQALAAFGISQETLQQRADFLRAAVQGDLRVRLKEPLDLPPVGEQKAPRTSNTRWFTAPFIYGWCS